MPRVSSRIVLAFVGLIAGIGLLVALPRLRSSRWADTQRSTRLPIPTKTQEEIAEEQAIEHAATIDESEYAQGLGIRYIKRVPTSKVALEAAFRQRSADAALMLNESEPLLRARFSPTSTYAQGKNDGSPRMLASRRPVLSIGLEMRDSDIAAIPWISRSTIVNYIRAHYVSLQANILKDAVSGDWFIHHRPIAAVAKFSGVPLTQAFVSPITETVGDIRGLGTYLHSDKKQASPNAIEQTAVWLFRSLRIDSNVPTVHYDYAFVRMEGVDPNALSIQVILTTNNRSEWHFLADVESAKPPSRSSDTQTLGTIHFIEYASDGLHPKKSATRSVRIKAHHSIMLSEIIDHLTSQSLVGDWGEHLPEILDYVAATPSNPKNLP